MRSRFNSSIHEEKRNKNKKKMYAHAARVGDASCRWKNGVGGGREPIPKSVELNNNLEIIAIHVSLNYRSHTP